MRSDERSDVLRCFTNATRGSPCEKIVKYYLIFCHRVIQAYLPRQNSTPMLQLITFRPISQSELDFRWPGMSPQRFRVHGTFSPALSSWPQMFSLAFGRGHEMMAFGWCWKALLRIQMDANQLYHDVSCCINWNTWSFCFEPWWILYCRLKLLLLVCGDLGSAVKEPSTPLVAIPLVSEARLPTRGSCYTFSYHGLGELWAVIGGLGCRPREFGKNLSSSMWKQPKQAPSEFEFDRPSLRIGKLQQSFNTGRTQADADNSTVLIPSLVYCTATITVRLYMI